MKEPTSTSSPALAASPSQPELMACEPSPCAKPTQGAKPSSPKRGRESRSGQTLGPSAWTTPQHHDLVGRSVHQKDIHGTKHGCACLVQDLKAAWPTPDAAAASGGRRGKNPGRNREDGSKRSIPVSELVPKSGFLRPAFPASQPHGPGSSEAKMMTVGSGRRLCRSLLPSDPLGDFSRILLESETWGSPEFYLTWDVKATQCGSLVWELVPSAPRTDECDTGLWQSGWPTPASRDGKHNPQASKETMERNSRPLNEVLYANWPTRRSEDSESTMALPAQAHGAITSGCLAQTEKFVVRLTSLSAWLMGYTAAYLRHWATQSSGRSRRKLSGQ